MEIRLIVYGRPNAQKSSRISKSETKCLKPLKHRWPILMLMFSDVKCIREHNGGIHFVPTFIVWAPHPILCQKHLFLDKIARFWPVRGGHEPGQTQKPSQDTSSDHCHITWYARDLITSSRASITKPKIEEIEEMWRFKRGSLRAYGQFHVKEFTHFTKFWPSGDPYGLPERIWKDLKCLE